MTELPSGTVTFLFTDIQGSTQLLHQLGSDRYGQILTEHHRLVRAAYEQFGGTEIDTQGDAFFVSFLRATEGVAVAAKIQRDLAEHDWPEGVDVRVRMGLHTGEPWLIEEGYVGMDVHRAARIAHVGHGGQVLLSETTTSLVQDELPAGVTLLDLGRHRLKDMRRPEHIHQLVIEGLPEEFPPLASLELVAPPGMVGVGGEFRAPREVGASPYRGLSAFYAEDAEFFFGREAFTDRLVDTLKARHLTAVIVGPSGSGKSSTVFAGLVPQLTAAGDWLLVHMRPGSEPFLSLAAALLPHVEGELTATDQMVEVRKMAEALKTGDLSLSQVVERALAKDPDTQRLLLVIDQFEELYTLCSDVETRQAFHDELLTAVAAGPPGQADFFSLLLTLRADFMGQALTHRPFADALQEGSLLLGPMNRTELQAAIEKPAEKQGAAFETGLVARILDDVGDEPGNLPLLEFALTLLWDQMDQGWLTHEAYEEIGRVDGALSRHADEVYARLTEREQEQARRIFVQLVQPGDGTEDTRRIARRADLVGVDWALVQRLADERLVVTGLDESGQETVEVVHEALIRSWGQLQVWMAADREFRHWQEGLRAALRSWEESGRDEGALLRGAPLVNAADWLESRADELSPAEIAYIESSRTNQDLIQARREQRRRLIIGGLAIGLVVALLLTIFAFGQRGDAQDNLVIADANAATADAERIRAEQEADGRATQQVLAELEAEARATQQAIAEAERGRAEQEAEARATQQAIAEGQATFANARNLALVAAEEINTDPQLGLLLALQAADQTYSTDGTLLPETKTALHEALRQASRLRLTLPAQSGGPPYVSFSPDGSRLIVHYFSPPVWPAEQPDDTVTRVWDAATGELLHTFPAGIVVAQWPPGDQVGIVDRSADFELQVSIWDTRDGLQVSQIDLEKLEDFSFSSFRGVSVNSDLSEIAIVRGTIEDARMGVWDLQTGEHKLTLHSVETEAAGSHQWIQANSPTNLIYSQDDDNLIFVNMQSNGTIALQIWDADTLEELSRLGSSTFDNEDYPIAISHNGEMLAGLFTDDEEVLAGQIRMRKMGSGEELVPLVSPQADIFTSLVFSPDGVLFAAASAEGRIYVWDLEASLASNSSQLLLTIATANVDIHDLAFSPEGTLLTSAATNGEINVWDIRPDGGAEQSPIGEPSETEREGETALALSPDGGQLAVARPGEPPAIWDTETGAVLFTLPGGTGPVEDLAYSPDGSLLATCSRTGPLKIWEAGSGQELYALDGYTEGGCAMAFHPQGDIIALGFSRNASGWWQNVELLGSGDDATTPQDLTLQFPWREVSEGNPTRLDFDSRGDQLAGITDLGRLRVWDPWEFMHAGSVLLHSEVGYQSVVYSPNAPRLVTTGVDGTVKIWDTETLTLTNVTLDQTDPIRVIPAHTGAVNTAAFSPDGKAVATGSEDRSIKIWDIETGRNLLTLPDLAEPVTDLAFSPDGARLYAATADGTVRVYILDDAELIELAQDHVIRSLTTQECQTYLDLEACPN